MKKRKSFDNILVAISGVLTVAVFIFTLYWSVVLMRLGAFAESDMPSMQPESGILDLDD